MTNRTIHDFGVVDPDGDTFEFHYGKGRDAVCYIESVVQTERGPKRTELASITASLWRKISVRVVRELSYGMGETELGSKAPKLKIGINRFSPMLGRELTVLLWALMEKGFENNTETILSGWRELAREERWWLFVKASTPGQHTGVGWRRALFYALSEPGDTRSAQFNSIGKKKTLKLLAKQLDSQFEPYSQPGTILESKVNKKNQRPKKKKEDSKEESNGYRSLKQLKLF